MVTGRVAPADAAVLEAAPVAALVPVALDGILRTGATYEGRVVRSVVIVFDDGRVEAGLPERPAGEADPPPAVRAAHKLAEEILAVLSLKPSDWVRGPELAKSVGHERTSGTFIRACSQLLGYDGDEQLIESDKQRGYRLLATSYS